MGNNDILILDLVKRLGKENLYLCIIYDGDYEVFILEALTPYGELQAAGIGKSLNEAIDDLEFALASTDFEEDYGED